MSRNEWVSHVKIPKNRSHPGQHASRLYVDVACTHSFQYGFRVRLMTLVVCICSPSTETIANGSGSLRRSRLINESAATTDTGETKQRRQCQAMGE